MNAIGKFLVIIFVAGLLVSVGCRQRQSNVDYRGTVGTPSDIRKTQLIQQLDRKWENPSAHFELGQLYHAEGMWEKAEYHYNIALGFDPVYRDAQAAMVKVMADSGDRTKSQITANLYITQASSTAASLLGLGQGFQRQGMDDYAVQCYMKALSMAPNSPAVNRQIGYYYLSKKDDDKAKEYLTRSFQLDSNQPEVAADLGRLGVAVRIPSSTTNEKQLSEMTR